MTPTGGLGLKVWSHVVIIFTPSCPTWGESERLTDMMIRGYSTGESIAALFSHV